MIRLIQGNALDVLPTLEAGSVHLCVTSPPYFAARNYNTPAQVWGGDPACQHSWLSTTVPPRHGDDGATGSGLLGGKATQQNTQREGTQHADCARCGAWRGDLGREPLHDCLNVLRGDEPCNSCYVCHMVTVCRAIRRVLRDDGLMFLNLDDSMAGSWGNQGRREARGGQRPVNGPILQKLDDRYASSESNTGTPPPGLKERDLCGIPQRVALALQADGWYWRSEISLIKSSPMPESLGATRWERCRVKTKAQVNAANPFQSGAYGGTGQGPGVASRAQRESGEDRAEWAPCPGCPRCEKTGGYVLRRGSWRPTEATEKLLLFAKTGSYFSDQESVRRGLAASTLNDARLGTSGTGRPRYSADQNGACPSGMAGGNPAGGNPWNWMPWPTKEGSFPGQHFATFPPGIPAFAIRAGTSERGCCPGCGAPWARVVERDGDRPRGITTGNAKAVGHAGYGTPSSSLHHGSYEAYLAASPVRRTSAWRPTCPCPPHDPQPCTVLDPFSGAGTSLMVADRLGRHAVGIDLNPTYTQMATARVTKDAGLFAEVETTQPEPVAPQGALEL